MSAQLRAELLKLRSTRSTLSLGAALLGLVVVVMLLHGLALPVAHLSRRTAQLDVVGRAELLGSLFAALLGALAITGEIRHGTIRPTFLVTPRRGRVVAAKVAVSMLVGSTFGLLAAAMALGVGSAALAARGVEVRLIWSDDAVLLAGCAAAGALWAAIGVGVGAVVRQQVPTLVGLCAWLLFVEQLLLGDFSLLGGAGRYLPGALAKAASGQDPQLAAGLAVVLLALYAAAAVAAGWAVTTRRDVA